MQLTERVRVARRFQRAVRIDRDLLESGALEGFVCPRSSAELLERMARQVLETGHGAFTWTGPYGSGKSSLVVALSLLLNGDQRHRKAAAQAIGERTSEKVWKALPPRTKGWRVVPVVARRGRPASVIGEGLKEQGLGGAVKRWTDGQVVKVLEEACAAHPKSEGGVLLVVDELGKFLEAAVHDGVDIFLLQEIAEAASRSGGRLLFVGVLHQAFDEYAQRVGREARDEWAKIQGRFLDLVVNVTGDEQLELLARAIEADREGLPRSSVAESVAEVVGGSGRRSADLSKLLDNCWPLHPIVACLLGPISRRRFGQNQRSIFGFLNSSEPYGFQEFLKSESVGDLYGPSQLWDYLRANLEPTILASPDGHRWSMAVEIVERCITRTASKQHLAVLKGIALIDLFRERSGLEASPALLQTQVPSSSRIAVEETLEDLEDWSLVLYRRHLGAYSVYAGSDFDMEAALETQLQRQGTIDPTELRELAGLQPILAKRHYHETGTLRWFDLDLAPIGELDEAIGTKPTSDPHGAMGRFLLVVPTDGEGKRKTLTLCKKASKEASRSVVLGLSPHSWQVMELATEFAALRRIQDSQPELAGDAVARREVSARLGDLRGRLELDLQRMFDSARWFLQGEELPAQSLAEVNSVASSLADERYSGAPVVHNELLNRVRPSSNAIAAQRALLRLMVTEQGKERLGISGFPAEGGLFDSIVAVTGLYRKSETGWRFASPQAGEDPRQLSSAWKAASRLLQESTSQSVPVESIYELWRSEPFGIREGLLPIFAVAFVLAERRHLAFYREGVFQPGFSELDVDYLTSDASSIQLRWMDLEESPRQLLAGLASLLRGLDTAGDINDLEPLEVARSLVSVFERLKPWAQRTSRLSRNAQKVRMLLKRASDPNRLIFDDIPAKLGVHSDSQGVPETALSRMREGLEELVAAYERMLLRTQELMLRELQVPNDSPQALSDLRSRAENLRELSGDFLLNAFITRLTAFQGSTEDLEGLCSLAVNKPPRDWVDADVDQANLTIAELCQKFVRAEAFARVKGRRDKRQAMAVVVGVDGRPSPVAGEFDVVEADRDAIQGLIERVEEALVTADLPGRNIILAALAEVSARYLEEEGFQPVASEAL